MGIILLVIVGGLGLFIFLLYATIKTKTTSLNKYEPFKSWVGQTVTLQLETVLFKEKLQSNENSQYPYTLLDSLHPQWRYVEERKTMEKPDLEEIAVFAAGTKLHLEKAIQYTNGVSGSSSPTIFGTIEAQGKQYKIAYQWGQANMSRRFEKIEEYWQFHQAPWQQQVDTGFYALPVANNW